MWILLHSRCTCQKLTFNWQLIIQIKDLSTKTHRTSTTSEPHLSKPHRCMPNGDGLTMGKGVMIRREHLSALFFVYFIEWKGISTRRSNMSLAHPSEKILDPFEIIAFVGWKQSPEAVVGGGGKNVTSSVRWLALAIISKLLLSLIPWMLSWWPIMI